MKIKISFFFLLLFVNKIFSQQKGLDEKINEAFTPVANWWGNLILHTFPGSKFIFGSEIPTIIILLVGGALFFTIFFGFINLRYFPISINTVMGKYDFIDKKSLHHGGAISPGLKMRYKALNFFTGGLPLLNPEISDKFLGDSTESSIHTGITNGIITEINEHICYHKKNCKDLIVLFSGGDAQRLSKPFKNKIFADTNFLAKGLNFILVSNLS